MESLQNFGLEASGRGRHLTMEQTLIINGARRVQETYNWTHVYILLGRHQPEHNVTKPTLIKMMFSVPFEKQLSITFAVTVALGPFHGNETL